MAVVNTRVDAIVVYLRTQPEGTRMTLREVCEILRDPDPKSVRKSLYLGVEAGRLLADVKQGKPGRYALPARQQKRYSIGWPKGYENGSPYDTGPAPKSTARTDLANRAVTADMLSGKLGTLPQGRGTLAIGKLEASADKIAATRRGSL